MHQEPPRRAPGVEPQKYPTPQTNTVPVVKVSSRAWWYLYNDPQGRLILVSAIIASVYFVFRLIDAIVLYSRISTLIAGSDVDMTAWTAFMLEIPRVHYITLFIGLFLNWIAYLLRQPILVLLAGVLYLVCAIAYIRWAVFLLPEIILCAIAYMALVRKKNSWI